MTLYTPAFQGPAALGQSISTILNLQLWQTLRATPSPNLGKLSFGLGVVVWGRPLDRYSHDNAEERAKEIALLAQFVFWGKVYEFGDGAVAQTHLSVPHYNDFREQHPETWTIHLRVDHDDVTIEADIPTRRYSFHPIVLTNEVISRYSKPNTLQILQTRDGGPVIGTVGNEFTRIQQRADMAEITSGGHRGWVHLPELSARRSEVVDFVGGVMRVFRGDWQGVEELMRRVTTNTDAPNELRTDAYLYIGLSIAKRGQPSGEFFDAARSLSPDARRCIIYSVMGKLAEYAALDHRGGNRSERRAILENTKRFLDGSRALFPARDPWLEDAAQKIERLTREG